MKKVTCSACRFYMQELNRCGYHNASCHNADGERWCDKFKKPTVFDKITESTEVLAPYLVRADFDEPFLPWLSTLTNESFETPEQAISATVEKLKEVCDE